MNSVAENIDCMAGMSRYPDKYFELAIVDPEYGIGINKMNYVKSGAVKVGGAYRRDYSKKNTEWDSKIPDKSYFEELQRVSANQIIFGGNYFTEFLPATKSWYIWDKRVDEKYNNDFADGEMAWTSFDMPLKIFRYLYSGMLQGNMKNKEQRFHPTQKPTILYRDILNKYAKQGDKILDTHLGSGSSRIACYDYGFDFTGFELDKDYFEAQEKRFKDHISQTHLFKAS